MATSTKSSRDAPRRLAARTGVWLGAWFAFCSGVAPAAGVGQPALRVEAAMLQLQRFQDSHALSDLNSAVLMMGGAVKLPIAPQDFIPLRRGLVAAWAKIFNAIELSYDPKFDPNNRNDLPVLSMPPCPGPQDVQDPKAREACTAAIKANDLKQKRAGHYSELQNIDEGAMASLEMTLYALGEAAPPGTPADFLTLDGILAGAGVSNDRRTQIDAYLRDPTLDWVTVPGPSVRAIDAALSGILEDEDDDTLSAQNVEVWVSPSTTEVLLARGQGHVVVFRTDRATGKVRTLQAPTMFAGGIGISALDAKALVLLYREMLSGSITAPAPQSDLQSGDFTMQERNFDRSHHLSATKYYITYSPRTVPHSASNLPCGYFTNYEIESTTWEIVVKPLRC